ncbi:nidogen-2-like [Orbicella faveolata]|uniref:nidogen-2-like n=1 Tax=Orbicella faveolata TaxID=48498 RepID=UPI0009E394FE|nr:nidogen-2-like [Orbicella faveolata]
MRSLAILLIFCGFTSFVVFKDAQGLVETKSSSFHHIKRASMDSHWEAMIPRDARPPTECEKERKKAQQQHRIGNYIPQCTADGSFVPVQCNGSTGYCWCVDQDGNVFPGTMTPPGHGKPPCVN